MSRLTLNGRTMTKALFFTCFLAPISALANVSLIPRSGTVADCDFALGDIHASCVPNYIVHLISFVFKFIGLFFLLMIIIAGYQIALGSTGIGGGKEAGYRKLMTAIIGFCVSVFAFFIIDWVICTIAPGVCT